MGQKRVAPPGLSSLELTGTVSVLQPNLCKIQVGDKKRGVMLGEPFLGRVGEVGRTWTLG